MSDRISADLPFEVSDPCEFGPVLHHVGEPADVLNRWRTLLRTVMPRGWGAVKPYAPDIMSIVAEPKVLFLAATELRARGPKAPGPNGLFLEALGSDELWAMCTALGRALRAGTYRPAKEHVRWVEKASGTGRRPIVISDIQDRVVQKAAALVLRPALDALFDPLSFAYRPSRGRLEAIAIAEQLTGGGEMIWLTHDLTDAYRRVPVPRLLDVFEKYLPSSSLCEFLAMVLPAQSRAVGGIKQGGPLSPLALELYLTHFLHVPWRRAGHPVRIVRYADDLLLTAPDEDTAKAADEALRELLVPAGMLLKHTFEEARRDTRTDPAEWLGFRFRLRNEEFRVTLGAHAFAKLAKRFVLAHAMSRSPERALAVLRHWVDQLGPCYRWEEREAVCERAITTAREYGFEEAVSVADLTERWNQAHRRWKATRRRVHRTPEYLTPGVLTAPTPTSVVW